MALLHFDCETKPQPEAYLLANNLLPEFEPPANIKDPDKIADRAAAHRAKALEDAALSAITGEICAIGWQMGDLEKTYTHLLAVGSVTEKVLLEEFWREGRNAVNRGDRLCGFNVKSFDLPFLIRRSWILGVKPMDLHDGKWWLDRSVVDLRDRWTFNDRHGAGSLATLATLFGIGQKTGSGADFAKLMVSDPEKAKEYLKNDVQLLPRLAARMGIEK